MKRLIAIDGSHLVCRAFYAGGAEAQLTNRKGQAIEVVVRLVRMLRKIYKVTKPSHVVVAWDKGKSWRHHLHIPYKAHRPPKPERLQEQWKPSRELMTALNIAHVEVEGFEADDIMATTTTRAWRGEGCQVVLVTSDKDMMQLVNDADDISAYDAMKGKHLREADVLKKYGATGEGLRAILALAGDAVDGIEGVRGIGFKRARGMVKRFDTWKAIVTAAGGIRGEAGKALRAARSSGDLDLYWRLVGLSLDVPMPVTLEACQVKNPDYGHLLDLYGRLHMRSEHRRLSDRLHGASRHDRR